MSATTEMLLEQIKEAEAALDAARTAGDSVALVRLQENIRGLRMRFMQSSQALNEGRTVLKG